MYWIAVIYFFVMLYLLGESVAYLFRFTGRDLFEDIVMKLGLGLAAFPIVIIILSPIHMISWWLILILSAIIPVYRLVRELSGKEKSAAIHEPKSGFRKVYIYYILLILIFGATMYIYSQGAFSYPYLEDGDPLSHALSADYIYKQGTYIVPLELNPVAHYLEPYPPFYSSFMSLFIGLTGHDTVWTLKFYNALLISLGALFIYFAVKRWTGSNMKALVASFLLLCINSYVSHFIFASSYATTMVFVGFYFLAYMLERDEKKEGKAKKASHAGLFSFKDVEWAKTALAAVAISSVLLVQPTVAAVFVAFLFIYWLVNVADRHAFKQVFLAVAIAGIIACLFWVPNVIKFGVEGTSQTLGFSMFTKSPTGADVDSSGNRMYSFGDFMNAPTQNLIDQPIGVGSVLFIVFLLSSVALIILTPKLLRQGEGKGATGNYGRFTFAVLLWTAFLVFLILGNSLPFQYKFVPHRQWAYFSIGVVLLTAIGGSYILKMLRYRELKAIILVLFAAGVIITSLLPKYQVETSVWGPGPEWKSAQELAGYLAIGQKAPRGTTIFSLCATDMKAAASNMEVIYLDPQLRFLKNNYLQIMDTNFSVNNYLKTKGIEFAVVDTECALNLGVNQTNAILSKLQKEGMGVAASNTGFVLLKVT